MRYLFVLVSGLVARFDKSRQADGELALRPIKTLGVNRSGRGGEASYSVVLAGSDD